MSKTPSARRCNAFVPRLESLEDRCLLSCRVIDNGSVLRVLIENTPNRAVQITDDGAGNVRIVCGRQQVSAKGVATILVRGGTGGDAISYNLTGALTGVRVVDVSLRGGADAFNASVAGLNPGATLLVHAGVRGNDVVNLTETGALNAGSVLLFDAGGSFGADRLNASVTGNVGSGALLGIRLAGGRSANLESIALTGDVAAGALVALTEGNGPGPDQAAVTYGGVDHGLLGVNVAGGRGADILATNLNLGKGSDGTVLALENGGPGNDAVTLNVPVQPGDRPTVLATLDGGPGFDTCSATANVTVRNCERMVQGHAIDDLLAWSASDGPRQPVARAPG